MNQLTFTTQFAVLRELHHAIRKQGESKALLGALCRAYANLGVLSEFHWTFLHKACKARALLYAQRLAARNPDSASALWHRAYAEALSGLHQRALADLEAAAAANKAQAADGPQAASEPPDWVAVIDAYCRFDGDKLTALMDDEQRGQLAGLLRFFQVESMKRSFVVQELAGRLLAKNPECFRLYDAMCDSCAIGMLHLVTEAAPAALHQTIPQRLELLSGLPADTAELLKRRSIRDVGLSELSDSLLQTDPGDDSEEFSWTVLGGLLQEVEFMQIWRRAFFMRYQWAVPTDEFIAAVKPLAKSHRFRPLIDLCATSAAGNARRQAAEQMTSRLDLAALDFFQLGVFTAALESSWQALRPEQFDKARQRPILHLDDVPRDLLAGIERSRGELRMNLVQRFREISPSNPDAVAAWIRHDREQVLQQAPELEKDFSGNAQVLGALANLYSQQEDRDRVLRAYVKLSPDFWAYKRLAQSLKAQNKMEEWKATIDEFLEQPEAGLTHAQMRVEVANYYMDRAEWEQARPYAADAAETWAEWAMLCAIRCYRGLGDVKREGLWHSRIVERYPKKFHWLEWYLFCRRHGWPRLDETVQIVDTLLADGKPVSESAGYTLGGYYQISGRPKQSLPLYLKWAGAGEQPERLAQAGLAAALVAQELGDTQARDNALQRVAALDDAQWSSWKELARWLQASIAAAPEDASDVDEARRILAAESDGRHRAALSYFIGRYLELCDRWKEAEPFMQAAASDPSVRFTITQTLASAALLDRGVKPESETKAPPADAAAPAEKTAPENKKR